MLLGLRGKLVGMVGAAIAVPLLAGIFIVWYFGYQYYVYQKGQLYEIAAQAIAQRQNNLVGDRIHDLRGWIELARVAQYLNLDIQGPFEQSDPQDIEDNWAQISEQDPLLRDILNNPMARQIKIFQMHNPLFAEIFITDAEGRVIAASNKTSNYLQAGEDWWISAMRQAPGQVYIAGLHYDESAGVYSRDVALAIYDSTSPDLPALGVIKGVINVRPLYESIPAVAVEETIQGQIAMPDGRVLTSLFGHHVDPLSHALPQQTTAQLASKTSGWFIGSVTGGSRDLIGFATVDLRDPMNDGVIQSEIAPVKVIIHNETQIALAPVRRQLWMISLLGGLALIVFSTLGVVYADWRLIGPLRVLREASNSILSRVTTRGMGIEKQPREALAAHERARHRLEQVEKIHSGDEMEQLAQGFVIMARRVLNYHEQLEAELEQRTQEYAIDLRMARDFQQAFLGREMIRTFRSDGDSKMKLAFDHIYKPAFSIGGDFYDVTPLGEHRVGIFIADVMGHGLRSALITAVLRTLLESLAPRGLSAAELMCEVNKRFYDLMPQSSAQIFATAFYLIADIKNEQITFTSAGHFSPLLASRSEESVRPLMDDQDIQPALGLLRESYYAEKSRPLAARDLILLFTDGVTEAANPHHEEFGLERLAALVRDHMGSSPQELNKRILEALHQHMDTVVSADDICLLAMEAQAKYL